MQYKVLYLCRHASDWDAKTKLGRATLSWEGMCNAGLGHGCHPASAASIKVGDLKCSAHQTGAAAMQTLPQQCDAQPYARAAELDTCSPAKCHRSRLRPCVQEVRDDALHKLGML